MLLGTGVVLAIAVARGWAPVLESIVVPSSVAAGMAVGLLGGVLPALRAARMDPGSALQQ